MSGRTARNALHVHLVDGPGAVAAGCRHAPGAIDAKSVERIAAEYTALLRGRAGRPGRAAGGGSRARDGPGQPAVSELRRLRPRGNSSAG
jgi:hypothetical protein